MSETIRIFKESCAKKTAELQKLLPEIKKDESGTLLLQSLNLLKSISLDCRLLSFNSLHRLLEAVFEIFYAVKEKTILMTAATEQFLGSMLQSIAELNESAGKNTDDETCTALVRKCSRFLSGEMITDGKTQPVEDDVNLTEKVNQNVEISIESVNALESALDSLAVQKSRCRTLAESFSPDEKSALFHSQDILKKQLLHELYGIEYQIRQLQDMVFALRRIPVQNVLDGLKKLSVPGKNIEFSIDRSDVCVDRDLILPLEHILELLLQNAVSFGLKDSERGVISVSCEKNGSSAVLTFKDDGCGIDVELLEKQILAAYPERAAEIAEMGRDEILAFLFQPGFTGEHGLDEVWSRLEKIKGHIKIESSVAEGTSFILQFPLSIRMEPGFFIFDSGASYFIPSQFVVDTVYRAQSEFKTDFDRTYITVDGQDIPVYALSSLLSANHSSAGISGEPPIVIVEYLELRLGIIVERITGFVDVTVKPLPPSFKKSLALQGVVLNESNDFVPVLYVPDLIRRFRELRGYNLKKKKVLAGKKMRSALVVDSSSATRQILCSAFKKEGFLVEEASDGIDALEKLKVSPFELIVSARNMPRMDGITLLDNVKRLENARNTPFVMLLPDDEFSARNEALQAGAKAVLSKKKFSRNDLMQCISTIL
ncbi:response regulator [Treponema sp.]|uniref:ATP-binding response regulator n=1 Tax=Treponema sp. TaxID=166 RepID=UPI003F06959F